MLEQMQRVFQRFICKLLTPWKSLSLFEIFLNLKTRKPGWGLRKKVFTIKITRIGIGSEKMMLAILMTQLLQE